MVALFHRRYALARGNQHTLAGPMPGLTLREWEVRVILCSLPPSGQQALLAWLVAPTETFWPQPEGFSPQRLPFTASEVGQPAQPLPALFLAEIKAMRQTQDTSLKALHGISRDLLLVVHGTRLRQITAALGDERALKEVAATLRLASEARARARAALCKRWGGRWAWLFS